MREYTVAVVGATGAVGREMVDVLEKRDFPVGELRLLASNRSAGQRLKFKNSEIMVQEATSDSFRGVDFALFSAGAGVSRALAPKAAKSGALVIDNSSAFRMQDDVPLVVPEVNPEAIKSHHGIIANPNCSTIQMVVALQPLHEEATLTRVIVSTYQAVSGTGQRAIKELFEQSRALVDGEREVSPSVYPHQIAFNVLPHIDVFDAMGNSKEELKMVYETRKIMELPELAVTATTVRVPVFRGHSESVYIETKTKLSRERAREILSSARGVIVIDNPEGNRYPLAVHAEGKNDVFVGRIREDISVKNGLNLWIVADNLLKGAAWNAVQIAEEVIEGGLI